MDGQARTNNAVEGWHNSFSKSLGSSHINNIWVFLKAIQKEQNLNEYRFSQANAGANTPQRRVSRDFTLRIENLKCICKEKSCYEMSYEIISCEVVSCEEKSLNHFKEPILKQYNI
ncbi:hypothetical protein RF11_06856 [Thelohanellus kitauei]|uniref:Uncharacterized protein n=1 Tax=Thelohanellus kitauei TaxID=669202 RepID=A0A0C2J734_THEKT|nr:hypothetical protein RF11_06856 [Thelohanellus kitauei]